MNPDEPQKNQHIAPEAPKHTKKPIILIVSVVSGVVVLGLLVWLISIVFFTASKADYQEAVRITEDGTSRLSSSYFDVSRLTTIASYNSETVIEDRSDDAMKSLDAYKVVHEDIAKLKALRNREVKDAYQLYEEKYEAFTSFADDYIPSAEKALSAIALCEALPKISAIGITAYKTRFKPCEAALTEAAETVLYSSLKQFVKAYQENAEGVIDLAQELDELPTSETVKRRSIQTKLSTLVEELVDKQKDTNAAIEKQLNAVSPIESYSAFTKVLREKAGV